MEQRGFFSEQLIYERLQEEIYNNNLALVVKVIVECSDLNYFINVVINEAYFYTCGVVFIG